MTGDIEGTLAESVNSRLEGVEGLTIELLDHSNEVVRVALSEFDGFYSFIAVPVGEYKIRVVVKKTFKTPTLRQALLETKENFLSVKPIVLQLLSL
jgi:hypothetical protein